jgi:hypothetical protein
MKYYIKRDLNEFGPYSLADLQRYVASGNISLNDLTRSEGMTDWVPVSQVLGNIPVQVPAPVQPGAAAYASQSPYGTAPAATTLVPPDFHWALVLLLTIVTCTLFGTVWLIVQSVWIRKIKPASKGLLYILLSVGCSFLGGFINGLLRTTSHGQAPPVGSIFSLGSIVLYLVGVFTMRSDLEEYYNSTENIGLNLSGVMTFFFAVFYFQHHFSRIAKWKKTGVLEPQG